MWKTKQHLAFRRAVAAGGPVAINAPAGAADRGPAAASAEQDRAAPAPAADTGTAEALSRVATVATSETAVVTEQRQQFRLIPA